jgi:hypothetical protein
MSMVTLVSKPGGIYHTLVKLDHMVGTLQLVIEGEIAACGSK